MLDEFLDVVLFLGDLNLTDIQWRMPDPEAPGVMLSINTGGIIGDFVEGLHSLGLTSETPPLHKNEIFHTATRVGLEMIQAPDKDYESSSPTFDFKRADFDSGESCSSLLSSLCVVTLMLRRN